MIWFSRIAFSGVVLVAVAGIGWAQGLEQSLTPFDGEGLYAGQRDISDVDELAQRTNESPCEQQTVAVLTGADGGVQYIFCGFDDGTTGVLEVLSEEMRSASVLGRVSGSPHEIIQYLLDDVPDAVVSALEGGGYAGEVYRAEIPSGKLQTLPLASEAAAPAAAALSGDVCANDQAWIETFNDNAATFYRDEINCTNHWLWGGFQYCANGRHVFHNPGGPVEWWQRTATAYPGTAGGACAAYGQVHSCGGWTLFEGYHRPSPGEGDFTRFFHFWVQDGYRATGIGIASSNLCTPGKDKDDFRFTGNSNPGAKHRYGAMFIHELSSLSQCVACTK